MHPRKPTKLSDAIKIEKEIETHPFLVALNATGYDLDDVVALTCIPKRRLMEICYRGGSPSDHENLLLNITIPSYNYK
jgi:hypothetical protein